MVDVHTVALDVLHKHKTYGVDINPYSTPQKRIPYSAGLNGTAYECVETYFPYALGKAVRELLITGG